MLDSARIDAVHEDVRLRRVPGAICDELRRPRRDGLRLRDNGAVACLQCRRLRLNDAVEAARSCTDGASASGQWL